MSSGTAPNTWTIQGGTILTVDTGANQETISVTSATATTFTATFAKADLDYLRTRPGRPRQGAKLYVPERGEVVWLGWEPHAGREQGGRRTCLSLSPAL